MSKVEDRQIEYHMLEHHELNADIKYPTNMRAWRNVFGLTQQALADKLGVSKEYLIYTERGNRPPNVFMLNMISKVLKVRLEDLMYKEPKDYIPPWLD